MSIPGELKVILKFQTKLVRRVWRRYKKQNALHRAGSPGLESSPVFFTNSFPKSGTHLLTQVLEGFPLVGPRFPSPPAPARAYPHLPGVQGPAGRIGLNPGDQCLRVP